jgi:hypothetical protein
MSNGVLFANPLVSPEQFDFLNVAGTISPGVCKLEGSSRPYKWDIKDAPGSQGASETYRGWRPSEGIKFKFRFWTAAQIDEFFGTFLPLLQYDATKSSPKPVNVLHPVLAANGITNLVTKEIGPLIDEGNQLWSVAVEFIEFRPAPKKNATSTPNGTNINTKPDTGSKPTAQEQQNETAERLRRQIEQDKIDLANAKKAAGL